MIKKLSSIMALLEGLKFTGFYAMVPALGGGAIIGAARLGMKVGYRLLDGLENSLYFGVIGAVNQLASLLLYAAIEKNDSSFKEYLFAHTIIPIALLGITALAAKVNFIAFKLSLFGTMALFSTGLVGNLIPLCVGDLI
jgi:hypothetical protein